MAKRGPKPKTAAKNPRRAAVPIPAAEFLPPGDLDDEARREYARIVAALARVGTLETTDPRLVDMASRTHSRLAAAEGQVAREGMTLVAGNGTVMPHPMLNQINSMTMRLCHLFYAMGLTPASAKHGKPEKPENKEGRWGELLGVVG